MRQARLSELFKRSSPENSPTTSKDIALNEPPKYIRSNYSVTQNDHYENLPGFDAENGKFWIYPNNLSIRNYQFTIVSESLFKNTLVCLPTGLGKTFIAAVVMYNFIQWYPNDIVIFLAPTRPLVAQQMNACRNLTGLKSDQIVELTGHTHPTQRKHHYSNKQVFFLTPQVLVNDLTSSICPGNRIRCLVFDEAHKATGNHSYCQVIRVLTTNPLSHQQFRILALTATPSATIEGLQTIIENLLISHLEYRTDESPDVKIYCHSRNVEKVVVALSEELLDYKNQLRSYLQSTLNQLLSSGAIYKNQTNPDSVSRFSLLQAKQNLYNMRQKFQNFYLIIRHFDVANFLTYSLELIEQHGLQPLFKYFATVFSGNKGSDYLRTDLANLSGLNLMWKTLNSKFNSDQNLPLTQRAFIAGHPKLEKLRDILIDHFKKNPSTRAMVFTQFRDSVDEILTMLKQQRPFIRPASFVGQSIRQESLFNQLDNMDNPFYVKNIPTGGQASKGISQKDQLRIMTAFREGTYNTLIATCIGEEGLDVGEVDLIVCFDATKSPIRLIQRLGRTGRARSGKIVLLLAEGREQNNYEISVSKSKTIGNAMNNEKLMKQIDYYRANPRMVPLKLDPELKLKFLQSVEETCMILDKKSKRLQNQKYQENLQSHIDVYGSKIRKLNFDLLGKEKLFIHQNNKTENTQTLTERFPSVLSKTSIRFNREKLQTTSTGIQSSDASQHFVATLRLAYLCRHNLTKIHMHASGIRSVDVSKSLTDFLSERLDKELPLTQTQKPVPKNVIISPEKSPICDINQSVRAIIVRGKFSKRHFFSLDQDPSLIDAASEKLKSLLENKNFKELRNYIKSCISHEDEQRKPNFEAIEFKASTPMKTSKASMSNTFKNLGITPFEKSKKIPGFFTHVSVSKNLVQTPFQDHVPLKEPEVYNNESLDLFVDSFLLPEADFSPEKCKEDEFSAEWSGIDIDNKENSDPREENKDIELSWPSLVESNDSQKNLDQSLKIISHLTNTSELNEKNQSPIFNSQKPGYQLVLNSSCDSNENFSPIEKVNTHLEENSFDSEDFFQTQLSPLKNQKSIDFFSNSPDFSENRSICKVPSPKKNSPAQQILNLDESDFMEKRQIIQKKKLPGKKSAMREFLLTQAAVSGDDSDDDFQEYSSAYEPSFVTNDEGDQSGILDKTSMQAVYLRSLRSPPRVPLPKRFQKILPHESKQRKQFNNQFDMDIYSQMPTMTQQDENYQLDSFVVSDVSETEIESPPKKRKAVKKLRRVKIHDND